MRVETDSFIAFKLNVSNLPSVQIFKDSCHELVKRAIQWGTGSRVDTRPVSGQRAGQVQVGWTGVIQGFTAFFE